MRTCLLVALTFSLAAPACRPKSRPLQSDEIDLAEARKRAALAEPILAAIKKLDPAKIPPVTKESRLPGFPMVWVGGKPADNEDSIGVYAEDLKNPSALNEVAYAAPHGELARCTQNVAMAKAGKTDRFPDSFLVGCTHLKHVILVRPTSVIKPVYNTTTTTDKNTKTRTEDTKFTKGSVTGDLIAIEIATGKVVGGVHFHAESSSSPDGIYSGTPEKVLADDLTKNVAKALHSSP